MPADRERLLRLAREPYSRDTTADAQRVLDRLVRDMSPVKRSRRFFEVNRFVREQGIAGEMRRDPTLTRRQAFLRVVRSYIGDELYEKAFGERR